MVPVYKTFTLRYNKVIYIPHSYIYHTKMTVRKDTKYMSQSSFGNKFKVTTWGESHGKALGAVVDEENLVRAVIPLPAKREIW